MVPTTLLAKSSDEPTYRETQTGFLALKLVIEVRDDGAYVRFGPLQGSFRRIGFEEIESVAVTEYDAASYGGWHWGIRVGPGGKVYRIGGDRGVEIERTGGKRLFLGSNDPDALADAIRRGLEVDR